MRILWSSKRILCGDCGERSLVFPKFGKFVAKSRRPPINPAASIIAEGGRTRPAR
jgi:hypothetical protein